MRSRIMCLKLSWAKDLILRGLNKMCKNLRPSSTLLKVTVLHQASELKLEQILHFKGSQIY
jgi:hypothetical protein